MTRDVAAALADAIRQQALTIGRLRLRGAATVPRPRVVK